MRIVSGHPYRMAALLCAATLAAAACFGDDEGQNDGAASPALETTRQPSPELVQEVDTRGDLPDADPIDLAARFGKTLGRAAESKPFASEPAVGSSRDFNVLRLTGAAVSHEAPPDTVTITATLLATTQHAYFYAEDEIDPDAEEFDDAAAAFEEDVWPLVTGIFGEPASPGVDGDPRIIVLQADLGGGVGGYVTGDDSFLRDVFPLSNEAEMVYLDRTLRPGGAVFSAVLAHELQHLIHKRNDFNEEAWVNEGLSEAAYILSGATSGGLNRFVDAPETQLNHWPVSGTSAHYGAGAAFTLYAADRVGGDAVLGDIARALADGPAGVDQFLAAAEPSLSFKTLFADWIVANVTEADEGPYAYSLDVEAAVQYELSPAGEVESAAHQWGTDYYGLTDVYDGGEFVLEFEGSTAVEAMPPTYAPRDGALWSNKGDGIDTRLTYAVDLSSATDPVLTFNTWYDIEPWYDFGYVAISDDDGATWTALPGAHTTSDDPVQVALGPGYYGRSGGGEEPAWVEERVDLQEYAGSKVLIRFEYVTDGATHGAGWAVDDVAVEGASDEALGPRADEGWVALDGSLPQEWIVRLILTREDGSIDVQDIALAGGIGTLTFSTAEVDDAIITIAGATEGTSNLAPYQISLSRAPDP